MGKNDNVGRRLSDEVARWATAAAALLATLLLGVVVFFYGNMPKDIAELRESVGIIKFQVNTIQDQQTEIVQSVRASQKLSERVTIVEQRMDRQAEQISGHEKRIDKLEDKPMQPRGRP